MFKINPTIALAFSLTAASLAIAPAQAASLNLSTWTITGDVLQSSNSATITNAVIGDDTNNLNISGTSPITTIGTLETTLGLASNALGADAQEGSGIYQDLTVGAGDVLSFNWLIPVNNGPTGNRIFAAIDGNLFDLISPSTFSYNFTTAGTVRVGVGVVDLGDTLDSAQLQISNATLTQVPTPSLLPGLVGLGLSIIRKRRSLG